MRFAVITLCVASQRVVVVVVVVAAAAAAAAAAVAAYFVMTQSGNFWIHPRTSRGLHITKSTSVQLFKNYLGYTLIELHPITTRGYNETIVPEGMTPNAD
jgi:hypothetical protein